MKRKFLELKPWQMFALIILPAFIREIFPFGSYAFDVANSLSVVIISMVFFFWSNAVGETFFNYSIHRRFLNLTLFKAAMLLSFIYISALSLILLDRPLFDRAFYWIIPIHILIMVSIIYIIYFVARVIRDVEERNSSLFKHLLAVWFFPIGVWWLQSKVNKLTESNNLT